MNSNQGSTDFSITTGTIIRFFMVAIGFFLIWYLRDLMLVILTSIVIASFVEGAMPFFKKIRMGRVFGVAIIYIFSALAFAGMFYLFAPLLINEIYNFATLLTSYFPNSPFIHYFQNETLSGIRDVVASLGDGGFSITNFIDSSKLVLANISNSFFQTLAIAFGGIFNVVLIVIISFYLSVQERGIESFLRIIIPDKYEDYSVDLWNRSQRKIALWVRGQLLVSFLIAVLLYAILSFIGIDYALVLAIIAGIMTLVPYGMLLAVIPAISFAFISGGFASALIVAGIYIVVGQLESFLFTPLIINKVVGLSPLMVILAVLIGYQLGGFWGLVLSVPVAVFIMELMNDIEKRKTFIKEQKEHHNG